MSARRMRVRIAAIARPTSSPRLSARRTSISSVSNGPVASHLRIAEMSSLVGALRETIGAGGRPSGLIQAAGCGMGIEAVCGSVTRNGAGVRWPMLMVT